MKVRPYSVTCGSSHVEAWSAKRLPFEPTGWLRDYRSELRTALRSMKATGSSVLYAEYATPDDELADLENVLLYNLGTGSYAHLAHRGVVCRRTRSVDDLHHVVYRSTEFAVATVAVGAVLATARVAETPGSSTSTGWWAAFRADLDVHVDTPYEGEFGIRIEAGSAWTGDIASSVKAVLDGLTAALHVHDGSDRDHVTAALSGVGDGDRLWGQLTDPGVALLGRRRLVRPHGPGGVAWNPADERCGYFEVLRGPGRDAVVASVVAV